MEFNPNTIHDECNSYISELREKLSDMKAFASSMKQALEKYGGHGYSDVMCENDKHSDYPCTCGFNEALELAKKKQI